jgi:alkanesulfonate monooxygenase SsuD/methylene tetrahydromethanopterin reductase-like flavin-dependent oxidoreductase (luciferase family)
VDVKLGLILPLFSGDLEKVRATAERAEAGGYDGVFVFDHFFPPEGAPDRPSLEAFATLALIGAATSRVTVGTLVTRASLRPAAMLAKAGATIDDVTGGRLVLGIGTGDPIDRPEHEAFGFDSLGVRERREHLAETVDALKCLFEGRGYPGGRWVPTMSGPLVPPPARPGGPPLWLGALSDEVVRLAGRTADGWNGWGLDPVAFGAKASILAEAAAGADRAGAVEATWAGIALVGEDDGEAAELMAARRAKGMPADGVWSGGVDRFLGFLRDLEDAAGTWTVLVPAGPPDRIDLIADRVLPALAR